MENPNDKLEVTAENAPLIAKWLRRGGLFIWKSVDLSDPGASCTTPDRTEDGKPYTKPHWKYANEPARHITDPDDVVVINPREVKRFHVAVRLGANGMMLKVTDGGTRRIRHEVAKAGEGAFYCFDYSDERNAVIMVPGDKIPLTDWEVRNVKPE